MFGPLILIARDPLVFVLLILALLGGVMMHNVAQTRLAAHWGDRQAAEQGMGVPDPGAHFDLISTLMYLLLGLSLPLWVPLHLSRKRTLLTLASGPLTLLLWALVLLLLQRAQQAFLAGADVLGQALGAAAYASVLHALFYLLPLPHLDGGRALFLVGPVSAQRAFAHLTGPGAIVTYIVWVVLFLSNVIGVVASPFWTALQWLISRLPW